MQAPRTHRHIAARRGSIGWLRTHGAELVGELAQYEDIYRLCYVRGPEGIIIGLAEELDRAGVKK